MLIVCWCGDGSRELGKRWDFQGCYCRGPDATPAITQLPWSSQVIAGDKSMLQLWLTWSPSIWPQVRFPNSIQFRCATNLSISSANLCLRRRRHWQVQLDYLAGQRCLRYQQNPACPPPNHHSSYDRNPRECYHNYCCRHVGSTPGAEQLSARDPEI